MTPLEVVLALAFGWGIGELAYRAMLVFRKRSHSRLVTAAYRLGFASGYEDGFAGAFQLVVVGQSGEWSPRWSAGRRAAGTLACCDNARRTGWLVGFSHGTRDRAEAFLRVEADEMSDAAERYANGESRA